MREKTIIAIDTCVYNLIAKEAKDNNQQIGKFVELLFIEHIEKQI